MTIHEGLSWLKELKKRREELAMIRDQNLQSSDRIFGDKTIHTDPVYDIKKLDRTMSRIAREIRILDNAIKSQNAKTQIENYKEDESVLGEIE